MNAPPVTITRRKRGPRSRFSEPLVPTHVGLPVSLLAALDGEADRRGCSRSDVIREKLTAKEDTR